MGRNAHLLRRFFPKSLYARVALIVILPIFIMQSVVTYVFFERHWDSVTSNLTKASAGQIRLLTRLYEQAETEKERADVLYFALEDLNVSIRFAPGQIIPAENKLSVFNIYDALFVRVLQEQTRGDFWLNTVSWPGYVEVRVQSDDGAIVFLLLRDRVFATTGPIFILWLVGTSVLLASIAIVFLRNQVRSILRLASAAEDFGRGRDDPNFKPTGATEVRRAGRAFIAMRNRITRHIDQRTTMLAGVSHDLRTPLTRMKLALALDLDRHDIDAMRRDIDDMERMLNAYLDFAGDVAATEPPADVDLLALAEEAADAADSTAGSGGAARGRITFDARDRVVIEGRRTVLRRAVDNLVSNALKYAEHVSMAVTATQTHAQIIVDDDGPGIDPDRYEDAFKPFERLDASRSQKQPGVGLGLSVVRDAARSHGGEIALSQSPLGGLRATLRIPR